MNILGQFFIGLALAIVIVGLAAIAERRRCQSDFGRASQPPAWRARRDCANHGHE